MDMNAAEKRAFIERVRREVREERVVEADDATVEQMVLRHRVEREERAKLNAERMSRVAAARIAREAVADARSAYDAEFDGLVAKGIACEVQRGRQITVPGAAYKAAQGRKV